MIVALLLLVIFSDPTLLLSFDTEYPDSPQVMNELLDVLQEHDIHATFFVTKTFMDERPEIIERLHNEGHEIACHTATHPFLPSLSKDEFMKEIAFCKGMKGFRAPYRIITPNQLKTIIGENMYDASGFFIFFPREIPTKVDDYTSLEKLHVPIPIYFWMLKHYPSKEKSYSFHPRYIIDHKEEFSNVLTYLEGKGYKSVTHEEYYARTNTRFNRIYNWLAG